MTKPKPPGPSYSRVWRHLVAAYVLFHAGSILIGSIPAPFDAMNRTAWKDPTIQDEFAAWARRASRSGLAIEPAKLEELAWDLLRVWMRCMDAAMTPFRSYQQYTGTVQAWSMFVAPHRHPGRLYVEIREPIGQWRPVYVARSNEWTWRKAQLDHIRFRSAIFRYAWPQFSAAYHRFAGWLAAQAARDFPQASHVRVRFYKYQTPSPQELRAGREQPGQFTREVILALDAYR